MIKVGRMFVIIALVALIGSMLVGEAQKMYVIYPYTATVLLPDCDSGKIVVKYSLMYRDSAQIKEVPVFRFNDSKVGRFLERFADSVCAQSYDLNLFEIDNYMNHVPRIFKKKYLPQDTVINNYVYITAAFLWKPNFSRCEGIVLTDARYIGLLNNIDEKWINQLDIVPTKQVGLIELNPYVKPVEFGDSIFHIDVKPEKPIEAILRIMEDGKVDPIVLTYMGASIQKYPSKEKAFNWIEDFYKEHTLPSGCDFYRQRDDSKLVWDGEAFGNFPH